MPAAATLVGRPTWTWASKRTRPPVSAHQLGMRSSRCRTRRVQVQSPHRRRGQNAASNQRDPLCPHVLSPISACPPPCSPRSRRDRASTEPFPIQAATLPDTPRRARRARPRPDRLRQDPRVRRSRWSRASPRGRRSAARRAARAWCSPRPASSPPRSTPRSQPLAEAYGLTHHHRSSAASRRTARSPRCAAASTSSSPAPAASRTSCSRATSRLDAVEITVLDEADHMADLGFLPGRHAASSTRPRRAASACCSRATLDNGVDKLVKRFLHNPVAALGRRGQLARRRDDAPRVRGRPTPTPRSEVVERRSPRGTGRRILFMRTKHHAKKLAKQLTAAGIPAVDLHGNLSQTARDRNLAAFSSRRRARARRDRRRRPRRPRRRHRARRARRPAHRAQGVPAPLRPHRARRRRAATSSPSCCPSSAATSPSSLRAAGIAASPVRSPAPRPRCWSSWARWRRAWRPAVAPQQVQRPRRTGPPGQERRGGAQPARRSARGAESGERSGSAGGGRRSGAGAGAGRSQGGESRRSAPVAEGRGAGGRRSGAARRRCRWCPSRRLRWRRPRALLDLQRVARRVRVDPVQRAGQRSCGASRQPSRGSRRRSPRLLLALIARRRPTGSAPPTRCRPSTGASRPGSPRRRRRTARSRSWMPTLSSSQ